MNKTPVNATPENITTPGPVRTECNSITFINTGTAAITVNSGIPVLPGQQYYEPGNQNEIFTEMFMLAAAGPGTFQVLVIRKFFI